VTRRPPGLVALSGFFLAGSLISFTACLSLLSPGGPLEPMWRLNPRARDGLGAMGPWAALLMIVASAACVLAGTGLWTLRAWGRRLAVGVLAMNLVGDLAAALLHGDARTLIGLPIGGAMIAYLLTPRLRGLFAAPPGRAR
jgi:hypothetical protein